MCLFKEKIESSAKYLPSAKKSAYDHMVCDSIPESEFAQYMENRNDMLLYVKLPSWFKVETPVSSYNPDWAIVLNGPDGERCYLVRETKGGDDLRHIEQRKTEYANKHFDALGVDYEVITPEDFHSMRC